MAIPILGFVFVIIATYFTYTNAKETGRNFILWSLLTFATGMFFQYVFPIIGMFVITIYWLVLGYTDRMGIAKSLDDNITWIYFAGMILSPISMLLILRHVAQMRDEPYTAPPPSPPKFD